MRYVIKNWIRWLIGVGGLVVGLGVSACPASGAAAECLRVQEVLKALFFYHVGFMLKSIRIERYDCRRSGFAAFSMLAVYVALLCFATWPHVSLGAAKLDVFGLLFVACALLASIALLLVSNVIDKVVISSKALGWLGRHSLLLLAFHSMCGEMRNALIKHYPAFGGAFSYVLEFLAIAFLMWLFSGPFVFFLRMPRAAWKFKK